MNNLFHYTQKAAIEASYDSQDYISRAGARVREMSRPQKVALSFLALIIYYAIFAAFSHAAACSTNDSGDEVFQFIGTLTKVLSYFIGALALLMFMVGGIMIVVGGTSSRVNQGFKILKNALIGLAVAVSAYAGQEVFIKVIDSAWGTSSNTSCVGNGQSAIQ